MNRLWTSISLVFSLLLMVGGCFSGKTDNLPSLDRIIGGILENGTAVDREIFSDTISCLVEGDSEGYAAGVTRLDSSVDGKDITDVVVRGRRAPDKLYRGIDLYDLRDMRWALAHVDRIKSVGVDTLLFVISYEVDSAGELYIPGEEIYLFYLNAFHRSGFRIWLALGHCSYDFPYRHDSHHRIPLENQSLLL